MPECVVKEDKSCGGVFAGCCKDGLKCVKERASASKIPGKCKKTDWNVGTDVNGNKIFTYGTQSIFARDAVNLRAVLNQKYPMPDNYKNGERVVINSTESDHHGKTGTVHHSNYDNTIYAVHLDDAGAETYTEFLHENIAPIREVFGYLQKNLTDNSEYMNKWENVITNALKVNRGDKVPTHYKWIMKEGEKEDAEAKEKARAEAKEKAGAAAEAGAEAVAAAEAGGGRRKRKTRRLKKKAKKAKKTNRKIKKKKRRSRTRTRKRSKGSKRSKGRGKR